MGRHRNNKQMKEKDEYPEKELSEIEASNLSDIEFSIMFRKILKDLVKTTRNLVGPTPA